MNNDDNVNDPHLTHNSLPKYMTRLFSDDIFKCMFCVNAKSSSFSRNL